MSVTIRFEPVEPSLQMSGGSRHVQALQDVWGELPITLNEDDSELVKKLQAVSSDAIWAELQAAISTYGTIRVWSEE